MHCKGKLKIWIFIFDFLNQSYIKKAITLQEPDTQISVKNGTGNDNISVVMFHVWFA